MIWANAYLARLYQISISLFKELSCARAVATAGHPLGPGKDCGSTEGLGPLKSRHVEAGFHMFPHAHLTYSRHMALQGLAPFAQWHNSKVRRLDGRLVGWTILIHIRPMSQLQPGQAGRNQV